MKKTNLVEYGEILIHGKQMGIIGINYVIYLIKMEFPLYMK